VSLMLGFAQSILGISAVSALDEVTVSATKLATPIVEVPATVSVITDDRIDRIAADDIKDLLRYEPGVSVRRQIGRFGLSDVNIRGIEGNRVLLEVDDVRLPDAFAIGSFSNATRDGIDIDLLKRVEIVRGSASSLYGSDALGGVVQFTTKDPSDLLKQGRDFHVGAKLAYGEADETYGGTATLAGRREEWSGLFSYTHRETSDYANHGGIQPDPQDGDGDSILAKLVWNAGEHQVWRLTGERTASDVFTDVQSALGTSPATPTVQTTALTADDEQLRTRVSLEQELLSLQTFFAESGVWRAYWQDSETTQNTLENRSVRAGATISPRVRDRQFVFDQRLVGGELTLHKPVTISGVEHAITYGIEATQTTTEQLRDGGETNLTTGVRNPTVGPDTFPVRDFPTSKTEQLGVYLQDDIRIGAFSLLPGVRVDRYELKPESDAIFLADNPTVTPQGMDATSVNPRLGMVWRATDRLSGFGSYSRGFRIPPYSDVNVGFTNFQFGYMAIPNPDLRPEKSDSYELGVRFVDGGAYWATSLYYNQYDDFIESFVPVGQSNGILIYQSQNLREVRIYGAEMKAAYPMKQLTLRGSLSYGRGDDQDLNVPFNSVDPGRAVLGLEYQAPSDRWNTELVATVAQRKKHLDVTTGPLFASPGYTTFDWLMHVRFTDSMLANVGLFNLTDKKYWEWSDVRGRAANDPAIDRFTQAGRTVSANLKFEW
jgi:hemoglobin/transferrin/lactoferrin receptor protein